MRIGIVGSTTINDKGFVYGNLDLELSKLEKETNVVFICGSAKGAEKHVQSYAKQEWLDIVTIPPYHMVDKTLEFHPRHFFTRNKLLLDNSDYVIIFWDGTSHDHAEHMLKLCKKRDIRFIVYRC